MTTKAFFYKSLTSFIFAMLKTVRVEGGLNECSLKL